MEPINWVSIMCQLPLIYAVELGERDAVELPVAGCNCHLLHIYYPITDQRINQVKIEAPNEFALIRAIGSFNFSFGTDSYQYPIDISRHGDTSVSKQFWVSECECRPQSHCHLLLKNNVVDGFYDRFYLEPELRQLCDRLLCLGSNPGGINWHSLRERCEVSNENWRRCLDATAYIFKEYYQVLKRLNNNP